MIDSGIEKRSDERRSFSCRIEFETSNGGGLFRDAGTAFDISASGLKLNVGRQLQERGIVKLYLPVAVKDISVPTFAEVMWACRNGERWNTGLRFIA